MATEPTVERYVPPNPASRIKIDLSEEEAKNLAILLNDGVFVKTLSKLGLKALSNKLNQVAQGEMSVRPNPYCFEYQAELSSHTGF